VSEEQHYVILDVETTGLGETADLLEVAMIDLTAVDNKQGRRWLCHGVHHAVLYRPELTKRQDLFEAHHKNGLVDECRHGLCEVDFIDWQYATTKVLGKRPIAVGRNVYTDLAHLSRHAKTLFGAFHYRTIDLTTIDAAWSPDPLPEYPPSTHRALHDCMLEYQRLVYHRWFPRG
jgi:oligoribonuclease (3'-5' exoribonuclease)